MKPALIFLCFLLMTAFASAKGKQPNVVFLLADDLGWKDKQIPSRKLNH